MDKETKNILKENTRLKSELARSEARFHNMVETSMICTLVLNLHGVVIYLNPAVQSLLGDNVGQFLGENIGIPAKETSVPGFRVMAEGGKEIIFDVHVSEIEWETKPAFLATLNDINDRDRSEDIIWESEEKFRLLLNSTGEAIYGIDLDGNCTFCNPSCLHLLGYENESQLLGRHMHDLIHHARKDGTYYPVEECCIYQTLIEGNSTHVDDEVFWRVDGTSFEVEYRSFPIVRDGNAVGSVVSFVDITERKQAEREIKVLNESLEERVIERTADVAKLYHALRYSPVTVIITDIKGNIEYANQKFAQLTGYSIEETIGANPRILKSGETQPEVYEELWSTIRSGNEWKGELCNKKKNGELYWEAVSISPVKDDNGVITNFIAVKDDITAQKKLSQKMLRVNEQLQASIAQMPTGYILWDKDFRVLEWNNAAEIIFGYSKSEVLGTFAADKIVPENLRHEVESVVGDLQEGKVASYSEKNNNIRKDGNLISCQWHNTPLTNESGKISAIISIIEDITKKMKMEEALIQSEKLKSIGTITAGISHEFNNLLAIISGNVQLLEEDYKDDKVLADALRIIMKAADDGAEISSNMLKFTKIHQNSKELISSDIRDMIMLSVEFTKPRWKNEAQARGVNYKMNMESMKRVLSIMCKPEEIREIFINMINNALDAMPGGGDISFSTWSDDDTVFVSVTDNGEGMPENVRKNIFDPFFSTKGVEGTGLGMSMAYGTVTRHGGKIDVVSKIGKGTAFTMQFPLK